ncbi:MAG: GAF domain-containing protein, partial [Candidatus Aminicenantes bacterium]|nr:GAF domain-containing protein [Candidatus Aminicenantes bacterium]
EISYLFTKLGKFEKNMKEAIRLIGEYSGVSRVYVFENFNNSEFTKNTYEWCNKNIEPQIDNLQEIPYEIIPSYKKFLVGKGMVVSSNILELPQDLIDILEPQKIKSIFILPIYVKDQFFGFMGFDECEKHRIWEKSEIELLKTVTNSISTLFERKQAEEDIKKRNEELEIFNRMAVGREIKMIELKKEINSLLEKAGEKPAYEIVE